VSGQRTGAWREGLAFSKATSWYHVESDVGSAGGGGLVDTAFSSNVRVSSCCA
jgi:hypothetical protein